MPFDVICGFCEKHFPIPEGAEGGSLKCPHCGYPSAQPVSTPPETAFSTTPSKEAGRAILPEWAREPDPDRRRGGCAGAILGAFLGGVVGCFGLPLLLYRPRPPQPEPIQGLPINAFFDGFLMGFAPIVWAFVGGLGAVCGVLIGAIIGGIGGLLWEFKK